MQLIKKTPIVGQLFKVDSKIALELEVLFFRVSVLVLFCLRILPRLFRALGQTLPQNEGCRIFRVG